MRDEIPKAIANFLEEENFDIYYEIGSSIHIRFSTEYLIIIVWYNPETSVSISSSINGHIGNVNLSDPNSFEMVVNIIKMYISRWTLSHQ